jgi:hypothetical protein
MLSSAANFIRKASASHASPRLAASACGAVRYLYVHEYISMEIMNQHGIATPRGFVAKTPEEAEHIFTTMMNKRRYCCCFMFTSSIVNPVFTLSEIG